MRHTDAIEQLEGILDALGADLLLTYLSEIIADKAIVMREADAQSPTATAWANAADAVGRLGADRRIKEVS